MSYLTFIIAIVIAVLVFVGLIYLWDHYVGEDMHKSTIVVLSIVTVLTIAILVLSCIFAYSVKDITEIDQYFIEYTHKIANDFVSATNVTVPDTINNDTDAMNDTIIIWITDTII